MKASAGLFVLLSVSVVLSAPADNAAKKRLVTFKDAFSGGFPVARTSYTWAENNGTDGYYLVNDAASNSLVFANIANGATETFVKLNDVKDTDGSVLAYYDYEIQASRENILFSANYTKQYRHSFFANYYVYNLKSGKTEPLVPDQKGDIQYAGFAPVGNKIAFVRGNDLYVWNSGEITRVTKDGSPDLFNAVPDWVYEEEIYGDTHTLWWSPDGEYIAYLKMDETGVPTFTIPYYQAGLDVAPSYPRTLDLRYPKVGATNPTVTIHLLQLTDGSFSDKEIQFDTFEPKDLIISEVAWVTDDHSSLIFRTMNRVQDLEKLVLVDVNNGGSTKVVRERDGRDGWLDSNLAITYIPHSNPPAYVDLSDESGWLHAYLYPVDGSSAPKALTQGEWEVTSIAKIDTKRGLLYYISTERDSTERHLYSVSLTKPGTGKRALVDTKKPGSWAASFSTGGGYYLLSYNGPDLPYQKLFSISEDGTKQTEIRTVNDNAALATKLAEFNLPEIVWSTIPLKTPKGTYQLNVMERRPPNFNPRKKYPLIFDIYGGPGSQRTAKTFRRTVDFYSYWGSDPELEYIVISVDNRGTGFKGRAFRSLVTGQLGKLESEDQVYAAQYWAKKNSYIDAEHIVIWGWSYGGFLSAKTIERNSGAFTLGLITAPVTDWRFYDSMYTERYMKTLEGNAAGYNETAVRIIDGFKNVKGGVLIQHGLGDDNVHTQNTATLLDTLVRNGLTPDRLRSQYFTDSDHSIRFHGANIFLYRQLTQELYKEKNRGKKHDPHQWEKKSLKLD